MMKLAVMALAVGLALTISAAPAHSFAKGSETHKDGTEQHAAKAPEPISGKVVETMDSGGYTYVLLEKEGKKTWVAVPKMKVKVGEEVAFMPGNVMPKFRSDTLKKTFDTIVFSPGPVVLPGSKQDRQSSREESGEKVKLEKVEKAKGVTAQTVADCYKNSEKLNDSTVTVHGKVVKVSRAIMGKNWVHIQDGTGDPKAGTHNLVVTTKDLPDVGDVVTATGKLVKDKDFGYGYKYDVIVEDATITK